MFVFVTLMFIIIIFLVFMVVMMFMGDHTSILKEKIISFECGVENYKKTRISFSMQFFFISIIFILFDMEIVFLIHFCYVISMWKLYFSLLFSFYFFWFLFITLLIEWKWNSLTWIF